MTSRSNFLVLMIVITLLFVLNRFEAYSAVVPIPRGDMESLSINYVTQNPDDHFTGSVIIGLVGQIEFRFVNLGIEHNETLAFGFNF